MDEISRMAHQDAHHVTKILYLPISFILQWFTFIRQMTVVFRVRSIIFHIYREEEIPAIWRIRKNFLRSFQRKTSNVIGQNLLHSHWQEKSLTLTQSCPLWIWVGFSLSCCLMGVGRLGNGESVSVFQHWVKGNGSEFWNSSVQIDLFLQKEKESSLAQRQETKDLEF